MSPLQDGQNMLPRLSSSEPRFVRLWIFGLCFLIFNMILLGGATRLTGSGLSITEWALFTGVFPPLNAQDWVNAFAKYRETSQYALENTGMLLEAFKKIYWWEWSHRFLGRLIGLTYLAGFLWITIKKSVTRKRYVILLCGGLLLAAQGGVGWIMVASGLRPGETSVEPLKLATHLSLAFLLMALLITVGAPAKPHPLDEAPLIQGRRLTQSLAWAFVAILFCQVFLGGLMAGTHAGRIYATWPLMGETFMPEARELFFMETFSENFFSNPTLIQFAHRMAGYVVVVFASALFLYQRKRDSFILFFLALSQLALGVATLLSGVSLSYALSHQGLSVALWAAAVNFANKFK